MIRLEKADDIAAIHAEVQAAFGRPPEAFLALVLQPGAIRQCRGTVRCRPEFAAA